MGRSPYCFRSFLARFQLTSFFGFTDNRRPYCCFRGYNGWNLQDGYILRPLVIRAVQVTPRITAFGFWVSGKIKNLHVALPCGLAMKHFMHGHGFAPFRTAIMQVLHCHLQPRQIVLFILHSVQPVLRPSTAYQSHQRPLRAFL